MKEVVTEPGNHLADVAERAIAEAQTEDVFFTFNGVCVPVTKTSTVETVCAEWDRLLIKAREDYENSPQFTIDQAERKRAAESKRQQFRDTVARIPSMDEAALRELETPWPYSIDELTSLITAFTERQNDYGTCVYAMSITAAASLNFVAHILGTTGFQASCADMDIIRRTRSIDGPFAFIKGGDMLYPQYDISTKVSQMLNDWMPWAKTEAEKLLSESPQAHSDVIAHWKKLAEYTG